MDKLTSAGHVAVLVSDGWVEKRVVDSLRATGLQVDSLRSGLALSSMLGRQSVDAVLVEDRNNNLGECLASLRFQGAAGMPVIAIGPGSLQQIIDALSQGASDYLCIADAAEMQAHRILARIILSRRPIERAALKLGDLELDASSRVLRCAGGEFSFTSREFEVASVLFEYAGEVVNLNTLSRRVWGREPILAKRTIEQHISRVRQKLMQAGATVGSMVHLQAIHNIGYRLTHAPMARARSLQNSVLEMPAAA